MNKQKTLAISQMFLIIISMFAFVNLIAIPTVEATVSLSESTSCCEKTTSGATCINTDEANCNTAYNSAPTSCESTSFCETGTCYSPTEGSCIQNTPKSTCEENDGVWDERDISQVPQCQLGCCVISDQAAFVSKTRCSRLSSFVGVKADYFTDVEDEFSCILLAQGSQMGACVYDDGPDRTCEFTSREGCGGEESFLGLNETNDNGKKFYADVLCSASELGTNCEKQYKTGCESGKVYWYDSCGNKENIYSSNSDASHNGGYAAEDDEICSPVAGSNSCGNCDYLMGGICAEKDNSFGEAGVNNFCQATTCKDRDGKSRKNGESWCVYDGKIGSGADTVGSRHFREICLNGEVITEGCADYRDEICIHDSLDNGFDVAACRTNLWRDCTAQEKKADCLNDDTRDCVWYSPVEGLDLSNTAIGGGAGGTGASGYGPTTGTGGSGFNLFASLITGNAITGSGQTTPERDVNLEVIDTTQDRNESTDGNCVPAFPPGIQFWNPGQADRHCSQTSATCTITWKRGLDWDLSKDDWEIQSGEECLDGNPSGPGTGEVSEEWAAHANQVCAAMGDCGGYINFRGKYTDDGYLAKGLNGSDFRFSPNTVNKINIMSIPAIFVRFMGNAIFGFVGASDETAEAQDQIRNGVNTAERGLSILQQLGAAVMEPFFSQTAKDALKYNKQITSFMTRQNVINSRINGLTSDIESYENMLSDDYYLSIGSIGDSNYIFEVGSIVKSGDNYYKVDKDFDIDTNLDDSFWTDITEDVVNDQENIKDKLTKARRDLGSYEEDLRESERDLAIAEAAKSDALKKRRPLDKTLDAGLGVLDAAKDGLIIAGLASQFAALFDTPEEYMDSIENAAFFGIFAGKGIANVFGETGFGWVKQSTANIVGGLVGIGVAYYTYVDSYEETETETVTFECKPWQAPIGQNECDQCSANDLPCSEYRCKSLGPTCGIVNRGTDSVECIDMSKNDAKGPIIRPAEEELTDGYTYSEISDYGFRIKSADSECLPSFSSIQWGIKTDEPAQCKIDIRHTTTFEDMRYYFGGSNIYTDQHTEYLVVPDSKDLENLSQGGITIYNGNEMEVYIRCRDGNSNANSGEGNVNAAEYAVRFCVDETPDVTPPQIISSDVNTGSCIAADEDTAEVIFYTNEPASCRWDVQDRSDFSDMQYAMTCSSSAVTDNSLLVYPCRATFTEIDKEDTQFYIKCQDEAGNSNKDASYDFSLKGSQPLKMMDIMPETGEVIRSGSGLAEVNLYAETIFGCDQSICSYSETGTENDYIMFKDTASEDGVHTQQLFLGDGQKEIFFRCVDSAGNVAENSTIFEIDINTNPPEVVRTYEDNGLLKVVTGKDATCAYSTSDCNFLVSEGEQFVSSEGARNLHFAEWIDGENYYIKCRDDFNNEDIECSAIVRTMRNFL